MTQLRTTHQNTSPSTSLTDTQIASSNDQHIKKELPDTFVVPGNVGTPEAVRELENAGADATKVGIGPGEVASQSEDWLWYWRLAVSRPSLVFKKQLAS